ncbi:MAG: FecR family protein, partial [Thermodesulfovibrionales bacterium]
MKIRGIIKALVLLIMVMPSYADAAYLGELRLSLIYGDVQVMTEDTSEWVPAAINMPLRSGDRIWVPEGARTEIQALNGTAIRLDEGTSLDILTVDRDSLQFYLDIGRAYLNFRGPKKSRIVQLDTPVSSVQVHDRATFAVAVSERGDTDISVFKGKVYVEGRSGRTKVTAGKVLYVTADYAELYPLGRPDAWGEWNMERDRIFEERGYSSRYLPEELDIYSGDLDRNGRWVSTAQYGYVWTPTVHVYAGWSPYRDGRWVWIGGDYVWIAYEPWGWVPYHYGRWSFIASFGWCWVPPVRGDVYWGPGYVGWVSTPTYVAWVPLAPEEVYYGYGHYGRHSVNIVNVNINTIEVKNVYRNTSVNNGITV